MNNKLKGMLTGLVLAAGLVSTGNAMAYTNHNRISTSALATHYAALTPLAMQYFCAEHRSECSPDRGRASVTMSKDIMATLTQVNARVNRAITPRRDTADIWSLNPTSGDCEDYVLSKRSALVKQGIPSGALRIAYTHTRRGEPHAVLVVKTNAGDYVLDNLSRNVKTLGASGYKIRSMSSANPTQWTAG